MESSPPSSPTSSTAPTPRPRMGSQARSTDPPRPRARPSPPGRRRSSSSGFSRASRCRLVAQDAAQDLARGRLRDRVDERELPDLLVARHLLRDEALDVGGRGVLSLFEHDERRGPRPPRRPPARSRRRRDLGVREQRLQLGGRHLEALVLDELLQPVDDEQVPSASMWPMSPVCSQPSSSIVDSSRTRCSSSPSSPAGPVPRPRRPHRRRAATAWPDRRCWSRCSAPSRRPTRA